MSDTRYLSESEQRALRAALMKSVKVIDMTNKERYLARYDLLNHLREQGGLRVEEEDAILDELDAMWDDCSEEEQNELREYFRRKNDERTGDV